MLMTRIMYIASISSNTRTLSALSHAYMRGRLALHPTTLTPSAVTTGVALRFGPAWFEVIECVLYLAMLDSLINV